MPGGVNQRRVLIISGAPGAGKTSLALPLAKRLGYPLLSKDHIKETLFDALDGPPGDLGFSRKIGGAAMALLWALAGRCPKVVIEANFRPHSRHERARIHGLNAAVIEVYCRCPANLVQARYAARSQAGARHPVHVLAQLSDDFVAQFDRPIGIGTVIEVDTSVAVDVERLVVRIRTIWPDA